MPGKEEYERVLVKAEIKGLASLSANEKHLFEKLTRESSSLGSRARKLLG
jgi:hypothetical protein